MKSARIIMLQIQREQNSHDLLAHRDILHLDTHTKLKHMTLHFLKYAGKLAEAGERQDMNALRNILLDAFIIALATANALNVNLGATWVLDADSLDDLSSKISDAKELPDPFSRSLYSLAKIAGRMAKAIESTDHLERGNPRADLEVLIVDLAFEILTILGSLQVEIEELIKERWRVVEDKSIFSIA